VTATVTLATTRRVALQLVRDPRTIVLVVVVPPALIALLDYMYEAQPSTMDRIGAPLVGVFPLTMMFLITSIAMLRERTSGTLERLMSMPITRLDLMVGYGLAFALVAAAQATITGLVAFGVLGIDTQGPAWAVVALAIANALLGMALGLFLSAFATSEYQAVQFMPAFVLPQLLLAGLFLPRERLPAALERVSDLLPFTYAYDALAKISADDIDARFWVDLGVVAASVVLALVLSATTLRRRTG
jgi:ABC-2 type transport system permease protein